MTAKIEIEIGRYWFRDLAEDKKREAKREYPGREVEIRAVTYPHTQSQRPTYLVILTLEKKEEG